MNNPDSITPKKNFQLSLLHYGLRGFVLLAFISFLFLFSNTNFANLAPGILLQTGLTLFILILPCAFLFRGLYREALTEFKDHEIIHYNLIGETKISWEDVVSLEGNFLKLIIKSKDGKVIIVRLANYKNPSEVAQFVSERIQHHAKNNSR